MGQDRLAPRRVWRIGSNERGACLAVFCLLFPQVSIDGFSLHGRGNLLFICRYCGVSGVALKVVSSTFVNSTVASVVPLFAVMPNWT